MSSQHEWTHDEWTDPGQGLVVEADYCSRCFQWRTHSLKPDGTEDFGVYVPDEDEPPCEGRAT